MLTNTLPRYEILDEAAMSELERGWRRIVSELGIEFLYDEALEYFKGAGQQVEGQLVKFDPDWILEQVGKAPPEFTLQARNPERIRAAVDAAGPADVVAYADCGTRGALDGLPRLPGADCYQLFGELAGHETGTYSLTDFLVRSFDRVVWRGLGLDRHPDLRDDYFRHYEKVVWLAQEQTEELRRQAERAAARLALPLEIRDTGDHGLEQALERILC